MDNVLRMASSRWWYLVTAVLLAFAALLLTGCGGGGSGSAHAAASSIAANPTIKADEQAAVSLIRGCAAVARVADVKTCILGRASPDKRRALGQCLAKDAAAVAGRPGAKGKFEQGAQACVATALAAGGGVSPLARIPGVTVTSPAAVPATASPSAS